MKAGSIMMNDGRLSIAYQAGKSRDLTVEDLLAKDLQKKRRGRTVANIAAAAREIMKRKRR